MGKKALSRDRRGATSSATNRSKRNIAKSNDKLSKETQDRKVKVEICSICLNQIKKPSLCSGCMHSFCFDCITKWSSLSENKNKNSCPVCRKEYSRILKNLNKTVKIVKLDAENCAGDSNLADEDPFYVFEAGQEHLIGLPVVNVKDLTSNIIQLNTKSLGDIPEIEVINMTRNATGARIITRHNYQLKSDEQDFLNKLFTSAVNRSVEEHSETVNQLNTGFNSKKHSEESSTSSDKDLTNFFDIYTIDRLTERPRNRTRNHNLFTAQSRYNLRDTTIRHTN